MQENRIRIVDIAERLGLSTATVSNVIHGKTSKMSPRTAQRVWQELVRGLMEKRPSRMFTVLRECGALARLIPELDRLFGVPQRADYHPEIDTGVHTLMTLSMAAMLSVFRV